MNFVSIDWASRSPWTRDGERLVAVLDCNARLAQLNEHHDLLRAEYPPTALNGSRRKGEESARSNEHIFGFTAEAIQPKEKRISSTLGPDDDVAAIAQYSREPCCFHVRDLGELNLPSAQDVASCSSNSNATTHIHNKLSDFERWYFRCEELPGANWAELVLAARSLEGRDVLHLTGKSESRASPRGGAKSHAEALIGLHCVHLLLPSLGGGMALPAILSQ